MRSTIVLLYVLAGPKRTNGFGCGDEASFLFPCHSHIDEDNAAPDQQCLRYDGFGGCDGEDSIWEVFHEVEEVVDGEGVYGESYIDVSFL